MKITIVENNKSFIKSFVLFQNINPQEILDGKKVIVSASCTTKTRVSTDIQVGDACHRINVELPGYKFDKDKSSSLFNKVRIENAYFKKTKNQEKAAYLKYLSELIPHVMKNYLNIDLEELTVEFINEAF